MHHHSRRTLTKHPRTVTKDYVALARIRNAVQAPNPAKIIRAAEEESLARTQKYLPVSSRIHIRKELQTPTSRTKKGCVQGRSSFRCVYY